MSVRSAFGAAGSSSVLMTFCVLIWSGRAIGHLRTHRGEALLELFTACLWTIVIAVRLRAKRGIQL